MRKSSILITGCSTGIGLYCAKALHERGYLVIATARKAKDIEILSQAGLKTILLDVDSSSAILSAVQQVQAITGGTLDAVFCNAGYAQAGAVEDLTRDQLRQQFETNVFGSIELIHYLTPIMRKQGHGRIIQTGSLLGYVSMPYRGAYNASKYALEALFDALRVELYNSNIHASLIEPGPINTAFRENALKTYQNGMMIEESVHKKNYETLTSQFAESTRKLPFSKGPEAVYKRLLHALENKRPKNRYYVTFPAYLFAFLRRILPFSILDMCMRIIMRSELK